MDLEPDRLYYINMLMVKMVKPASSYHNAVGRTVDNKDIIHHLKVVKSDRFGNCRSPFRNGT